MSELIVDMPMPHSCFDCSCHNGESGYCQADKHHRYIYNDIPKWCPIVGVLPEQHGDLVDADAIYERAGQKKGEADPLALVRELWSAPVIIAAERKDDGK